MTKTKLWQTEFVLRGLSREAQEQVRWEIKSVRWTMTPFRAAFRAKRRNSLYFIWWDVLRERQSFKERNPPVRKTEERWFLQTTVKSMWEKQVLNGTGKTREHGRSQEVRETRAGTGVLVWTERWQVSGMPFKEKQQGVRTACLAGSESKAVGQMEQRVLKISSRPFLILLEVFSEVSVHITPS